MSIRAQFYITGDTQQSGFRRIGSSESFPADHLPLLNNGEVIQEKARVEAGGGSQGAAGIQVLSHVWEYQTGRFGVPVMINTMVAIGTGLSYALYSVMLMLKLSRRFKYSFTKLIVNSWGPAVGIIIPGLLLYKIIM